MSIVATFNCDGCHRFQASKKIPQRRFIGVNGKSHGFGHWEYDTFEDIAPNDWVAFDPYTGCCYCPECWAGILSGDKIDAEITP